MVKTRQFQGAMAGKFLGVLIALQAVIWPCATKADDSKLTIFAAASLTSVLADLTPLFEQETSSDIEIVVAGTGALARQIENGAPADVFLSANEDWMAYLENAGSIDAASRRAFASNRLALIAPTSSTWSIELGRPDLSSVLDGKPFALGNPTSVPAGIYGAQALRALKLYEPLTPSFAFAPNVRVVLAWVTRGDAAAGLVYVTDTLNEPSTRVVTILPEESHDPISYWAAHVTQSDNDLSGPFLDFLMNADAQTILVTSGFALPESRSLDPLRQSP